MRWTHGDQVDNPALRAAALPDRDGGDVPRIVDAGQLARYLGVSRHLIYHNAERLGAIRLGDGQRAALESDVDRGYGSDMVIDMANHDPGSASDNEPLRFVRRIKDDEPVASPQEIWDQAVKVGRSWQIIVNDVDRDPGRNQAQCLKQKPSGADGLAELVHDGHDQPKGADYFGRPFDVRGSIYLEGAALGLLGGLDEVDKFLAESGIKPNNSYKAVSRACRRGCESAREVAVLIRSQLAIGAWGRWRVLFECRVVARLMAYADEKAAEAWLLQARYDHVSSIDRRFDKTYLGLGFKRLGFKLNKSPDASSQFDDLAQMRIKSAGEVRAKLRKLYPSPTDGPGMSEPRCDYVGRIDDYEFARPFLMDTAPGRGDDLSQYDPLRRDDEDKPARWKISFTDLVTGVALHEKKNPEKPAHGFDLIQTRTKGRLKSFALFDEEIRLHFWNIGSQASHAYFVSDKESAPEEAIVDAPTSYLIPGLLACEDLLTLAAVIQQVLSDVLTDASQAERLADGMLGISLSLLANGHRHFVGEVEEVFKIVSYWGASPLPDEPETD